MSLVIDISRVKDEKIDVIGQFNGLISFPEDGLNSCYVEVNYKLSDVTNGIYVSGDLNLNLNLLCSRCLDEFNYNSNLDLSEFCDYFIAKNDPEYYFIEENKLNFKEILRQKIILFLPLKPLCSLECKGLCFKCGIDLNKYSCNCVKNETDPRWNKLFEIF